MYDRSLLAPHPAGSSPAASRPDSAGGAPKLSLLVCALVLAAIAATAALTARSLSRLVDAQAAVTRSQQIDGILSEVLNCLVNAETGERGFLLTGRASYLEPYYAGLAQLLKSRDALTVALADDPSAANRLDTLNRAIVAKLEVMTRLVGLKSEGRSDQAMDLLLTDIPKESMDAARDALQTLADGESRRSEQYRADHAREIRTTYWVLGGSIALNLLLLAALFEHLRRFSVHEREGRLAMASRNGELSRLLGATAAHNEQVRALSELIRLLQSCSNIEEAGGVLQNQLPALMHADRGALYLFSASRNQLRQALGWGGTSLVDFLEPADCWALRLGQRYQPGPGNGVPHCRHLESADAGASGRMQCLPMVAHGDLMGLLVLDTGAGTSRESEDEHFRGMTLEQVALAIGNLQLRESLRQQSIRDALTGLYNRRFFEEAAQRELLRASRLQARGSESCLAFLMIDVDGFKRFNDQHGHEIGDRVLREVGQVLQREVRGSDVAARYGGEEFSVLITDMTMELGVERAEQIRLAVERMAVAALGRDLSAVTISVGVAQFPRHGDTVEALLLAADNALYEAKNAGRNRVSVAA